MNGRHETWIERQIREAQERGAFEDLPGSGKPLPGANEPYDENWWVKGLMRRENIRFVGPRSLALRKEVEDLPRRLSTERSEQSVREIVEDLNLRIREARLGPTEGPPVVLELLDVDEVVRTWREQGR
ncbi:putative metal-dependent hydrolase [Kutzneria viridogrisea]|uniref:DnaJ homologue subfamily C member 28 conserved domain-containing protein n=2 Tax=Kutzneria TaxID=43356 RepID=W5WFV2_9PSEU|nr:DUF1992 domain-containing protein [Kutzneria albida]AHH99486.1 hypothetical protein KALB_6126 [Kutzneria albida DSM 43870]MBA8922957.1 putative metal-dependent hydrolase [Kutzneria viridogrisea]